MLKKAVLRNADPDLSDPSIFGPLGSRSGFISQRYGSGSGSFCHQAKIVKKLDSYCFVTSFLPFSLKNDVNVPSKSNKQQKTFLKKLPSFLLPS
jgi:hypothetical protein